MPRKASKATPQEIVIDPIPNSGREPAYYEVEIRLHTKKCLILQSKDKSPKKEHAVACFSCAMTKANFAGTCLIGTLHFHPGGRPTAAPMLMATEPLGPKDYLEIARHDMVTFLSQSHPID